MSAPTSRRGFLRGLTTLPLIGGAVSLVGSPSAVAEPCTDAMLDAYVAFLAFEHRAALVERSVREAERYFAAGVAAGRPCRPEYVREVRDRVRATPPMFVFPSAPAMERMIAAAEPSSRAALVLSAVGADWR